MLKAVLDHLMLTTVSGAMLSLTLYELVTVQKKHTILSQRFCNVLDAVKYSENFFFVVCFNYKKQLNKVCQGHWSHYGHNGFDIALFNSLIIH